MQKEMSWMSSGMGEIAIPILVKFSGMLTCRCLKNSTYLATGTFLELEEPKL